MVKKNTTSIDIFLGLRLRQARTARGMSQERLGELLGITFQQVQKYEKGDNRIAVARLLQMTEILGVRLDDLLSNEAAEPDLIDTETRQLVRLCNRLNPAQRACVLRLVETCAEFD